MRIYVLVLLLILTFSNPAYASKDWDRSVDVGYMRGLDGIGGSGGMGFGADDPWDIDMGSDDGGEPLPVGSAGFRMQQGTSTDRVVLQTGTEFTARTGQTSTVGSTTTNDTTANGTDEPEKKDDPLVTALRGSGIIVGNGGSATVSETGDSTGIFRETGDSTGIFSAGDDSATGEVFGDVPNVPADYGGTASTSQWGTPAKPAE